MHTFRCPICQKEHRLPNVLRCPFCNKDLSDSTDELAHKHLSKCAYYLNPYKYSDRKRGRPKRDEYRE